MTIENLLPREAIIPCNATVVWLWNATLDFPITYFINIKMYQH